MTDRLAHRGPDGRGIREAPANEWLVALGHRRLSIIDVEGGRQPLGNEDGTVWISFNGEIYNFQQLRDGLERQGHRFATHCDTETIVHHYEQNGAAGLPALRGMFAFAIWDGRSERLVLARDRVGIKPLYYVPLPDGGLAFASELSALLEHEAIDRSLDPTGLASLFFLDYAHPPHTLVRGVHKLEPGHYLVWRDGRCEPPRPYWTLNVCDDDGAVSSADFTRAAEELRLRLNDAVAAQLVADVPVGVFLSGGIDSSLVAAIAQHHASRQLQSFSIGFADAEYDESAHARRVAAHIGSSHVEHVFTDADVLAAVDDAIACLDEPIGDPSIVPTFLLSRIAAEHVKVVLGGDGGDELWGGYPTYLAHRFATAYGLLPRVVRQRLINPIVRRMPVRHGYQRLEWKAKRFALRWDDEQTTRHLRWMSSTDMPEIRACVPAGQDEASLMASVRCGTASTGALNDVLALDFTTYLPGSVLAKVDRASMAHGLEVRPPLLDDALIDFAFSLPSSVKVRGRTTKALLKRVAAAYLPAEIIHRRKKGFAVPLARWLNGPLRPRLDEVLRESPLWDTGQISRDAFTAFACEHRAMAVDRSRPLWTLLVLHGWFTRVIG